MANQIEELLAKVPATTGSAAYEALDQETKDLLTEFEAWLTESDGKAGSTANAYKSYVAQALASLKEGKEWTDLSTDVRSGVRAFIRFQTATAGEPAEDSEDDEKS